MGLGHRRLAIIDPTPAGHQPMHTEDGRFVLSYNGEVYNFRELRGRARGAGPRVPLAHATPRSCSTRSHGGAQRRSSASTGCSRYPLWDRERHDDSCSPATATASSRSTRLASATPFLFGSEVKAILAHPGLPGRAGSSRRLLEYLTFQNLFTDRTLFEASSCCRRVLHDAGARRACTGPRRYWDFEFSEPEARSDQGRVPRGARPAVPPGGQPPARRRRAGRLLPERGHGLGLDHRAVGASRSRSCGRSRSASTCTPRRARARLRRAHAGRAHVLPVRHRALRDGAQGGGHGARHAAPGVAPRGAARRAELPELLRRPACGASS